MLQVLLRVNYKC